MKKNIKNIITVFIALILVFACSANVYANSDTKEKEYLENYTEILKAMKDGMEGASKTGDVTADFLSEMIRHHQGAGYMAENVIKYGSNKKVRNVAKSIIREQINGITEMSAILDCIEDDLKIDKEKEVEYLKKYEEILKKMISKMECIKPTGNVDKDFLEGMIPHHEGAIEMAKNISKFTDNKAVRKIAGNIEKTQNKEIEEMKKLLEKIK